MRARVLIRWTLPNDIGTGSGSSCRTSSQCELLSKLRSDALRAGKGLNDASLVLAKVPAFGVQNDGKPVPK